MFRRLSREMCVLTGTPAGTGWVRGATWDPEERAELEEGGLEEGAREGQSGDPAVRGASGGGGTAVL